MMNLKLAWRNCETDTEYGPFSEDEQIKKAICDIVKVVIKDEDDVKMQVAFKEEQAHYRLLRFEGDGTSVIITSDVNWMGFSIAVPDMRDKEQRKQFCNTIIDAIKFLIERVDY